jgi:hypothetical protein
VRFAYPPYRIFMAYLNGIGVPGATGFPAQDSTFCVHSVVLRTCLRREKRTGAWHCFWAYFIRLKIFNNLLSRLGNL